MIFVIAGCMAFYLSTPTSAAFLGLL